MPELDFSASYDSTAKSVTALVCLLLIVVAWLVHIIYIALLFPLLIFLAYAYSPRGYAISQGAVVVKRLIGNIRIPLADIREIRPGTPADFTACVKLAGNGGLFGYYGLFRTATLGKCSWYMTNKTSTVILSTSTRTLVLSPDDQQGFLALLHPSSGAQSPYPAASADGNLTGKIVAFLVAASVLALIALALEYSPGPPAYSLTAGSLAIHDKFYPVTLRADTVAAAAIRVVDLARNPEWRPTSRLNGFASRHYQSGWFRVAGGQTVRLYRAGGNRLVLIPPKNKGTFVLYQAPDPDRLAQELQRQWIAH